MQAKQIQCINSDWANLVSRAIHLVLARQEVGYAQLASELSRNGITESARSVQGKVQRGTFKFAFFLQAIDATRWSPLPPKWEAALSQEERSWEYRAAELLMGELALQPWIGWDSLSRRLEDIGIHLPPDALGLEIEDGSFTAALYFQCATVCNFDSSSTFLDMLSVYEVIKACRSAS
ncbi:hypothetical protein SAMN04487926_11636 [Paraburkholderia steynii]|uniref:DUF6471 domain-containing protein n=1 Tax=Paraburkholderia steynii TaxID=1245441 RepID=A0A7Z7FIZ2_9BURK|nr:DUF6471 domain-containing protein [Paraburkholderia steynii]SDI39020.1 hypothetical protein SAMN04487926_11636 [Paraburkholderia steynii]